MNDAISIWPATHVPLTCVDTLERHGDEQHLAINDRIGLLWKQHNNSSLQTCGIATAQPAVFADA